MGLDDRLHPVAVPQPGEDPPDMGLTVVSGQDEPVGDLAVCSAPAP